MTLKGIRYYMYVLMSVSFLYACIVVAEPVESNTVAQPTPHKVVRMDKDKNIYEE